MFPSDYDGYENSDLDFGDFNDYDEDHYDDDRDNEFYDVDEFPAYADFYLASNDVDSDA